MSDNEKFIPMSYWQWEMMAQEERQKLIEDEIELCKKLQAEAEWKDGFPNEWLKCHSFREAVNRTPEDE
ncbi:hypothetical protein LCGC14_2814020 [marine sediment metagenome]|uniref:Uncharacterized protein n=1 Tax=marine sediment metagenome TaxID=412755 RepID=A0A0F8Z5X4_9ZZZZ